MNRTDAVALMEQHTTNPALRQHMLAVEAAMRAYAKQYAGDEEAWGAVGLLHDFDYEAYPNPEHSPTEGHPAWGVKLLRERGLADEQCRAILGFCAAQPRWPRPFAVDERAAWSPAPWCGRRAASRIWKWLR
jgi:putative nucleotidyltransferase with HDIG domain